MRPVSLPPVGVGVHVHIYTCVHVMSYVYVSAWCWSVCVSARTSALVPGRLAASGFSDCPSDLPRVIPFVVLPLEQSFPDLYPQPFPCSVFPPWAASLLDFGGDYHPAGVSWPLVSGPVTAPELWPQHLSDRVAWVLCPFSMSSCLNARPCAPQGRNLTCLPFPLISSFHLCLVSSAASSVSSLFSRVPALSPGPLLHLCPLALRTGFPTPWAQVLCLAELSVGLLSVGTELWHESHLIASMGPYCPQCGARLQWHSGPPVPWLQLSPATPPSNPSQAHFPTPSPPPLLVTTSHLWRP